ncbi:transposase [Rhodovastum atsumiense]|nr:transposase [Rhodovastum atsumiense]
MRADRRPEAVRQTPSQALAAERAQMVAVTNEARFADAPPTRIGKALADEGIYIASESSFHRVLRAHGQMNRRGCACLPWASRPPTTHMATRPGEVWCWDVTLTLSLPTAVQGRWFHLYLILDLFNCKIVGFEVHDRDSAEHAAHLVRRAALAEGVHEMPTRPVFHGDNGATLKDTTVLTMLHWLGISPSYSRPRVSDNNASAEAVFRTAKYRPGWPPARRLPCALPGGTQAPSPALESADPQLDPNQRGHAEPKGRRRHPAWPMTRTASTGSSLRRAPCQTRPRWADHRIRPTSGHHAGPDKGNFVTKKTR